MKVYYKIDLRDAIYVAQMDRPILTPNELEQLQRFGEPLIQVGGTFTGTVNRPGYTNTTLSFTGGGGSSAAATPILNLYGAIIGATITNGGTGYTSAPTIGITGVGTGAALTAVLTAEVVTGITVVTGGTGYQQTPATVNFTLPSTFLRMLADFPTTYLFSLYDTYDADANATVWCQTIEANLIAARNTLLSQMAPLEGETLQTV